MRGVETAEYTYPPSFTGLTTCLDPEKVNGATNQTARLFEYSLIVLYVYQERVMSVHVYNNKFIFALYI